VTLNAAAAVAAADDDNVGGGIARAAEDGRWWESTCCAAAVGCCSTPSFRGVYCGGAIGRALCPQIDTMDAEAIYRGGCGEDDED